MNSRRRASQVLELEAIDADRCSLVGEMDRAVVKVLIGPVLRPLVVAQPAVESPRRFEARCAAMPLADQRRPVACLLEELGKQHLVVQPVVGKIRSLRPGNRGPRAVRACARS